MTSMATVPSPRKRSKHDLRMVEEEQEKISQMVRSFYDKTKGKLTKALTKCETRNVLLCRELFQALALHPAQQLYETTRLHDLIFNEIDLITQAVGDFVKRLDSLQDRLRGEVMLQQERSWAKRERVGENGIAVLRKLSFKREKHALKQRLMGLDTINRKLLKCESQPEGQPQQGFRFDIEGKMAEPLVMAYSKIWFQSKRREYLLCLGSHQGKNQFYIFNDKLQTIAAFSHPSAAMGSQLAFLQLENFLYFMAPHQITRISLLNEEDALSRCFPQRIIGAQVYMGGLALWVADRAQHHSILFTDSELEVYCRTDLKLTVSAVPFRFRLRDTLYFLTRNYYRPPGLVELLRVQDCAAVLVGDVGVVQEVIPVRVGNTTEEVIFRLSVNKFLKVGAGGVMVELEVDIEHSESIRSCAVLGEHLYALCENGKTMLECHYVPPNPENP